jgi:Na+/H+-translocating membrane pyrophosphatase
LTGVKSDRTEAANARSLVRARKAAWPEGATAGLVLVAAACLGLSMTIYQLAGPRDAFAESVAD